LHELQKQFHKFINQHQLVNKGEKVLLAISGGLDSMAMAELFRTTDYSFSIAHCNFGLRGEESDQDEYFVSEWARDKGIGCFTKRIEITGNSIQLEAREKRYLWFDELCEEKGFHKVATAHHLNDSLETTLLNLTRGTGIKGLTGVPIRNGEIIRPLLSFSRSELAAFAKENDLQWREDSSNAKTDYHRNKIRLEVVPKLKEINKSLEQTFKHTNERMGLLTGLVDEKVANVLSEYFDETCGELRLDWLKKEYDLLLLSEILSGYGFNYVTAKEVFEAKGQSGKTFETSDWKVIMDRQSLFIRKVEQRDFEEVWIEGEGNWKLPVGQIEGKIESGNPLVFPKDGTGALLDKDKLVYPMKVRRWQVGDTFQPLGMTGRKKISDLLIDRKVPLAKKDQVLVLESEGEIAWVIGYQISEKFKVDEDTSSTLKLIFMN